MANYPPYNAQPGASSSSSANNLQFYTSTYTPSPHAPVSGHATPSQASYYASSQGAIPPYGAANAYGSYGGPVSGRMGESGGGLRTGWIAAFSTEGYDGEPGLLEELNINFGHIRDKTLAVLNPLANIDQHMYDDSDLSGPVIFFLLFGTFLLFSGKVHFGYIYGLALLGSISLHLILSLMSPTTTTSSPEASNPPHQQDPRTGAHLSSTLTYPRSASVLGYCLLPLVLTSLVGVALPMDGMLGYILTSLAITWCTFSASGMFVSITRMSHMRILVAYPLALFYVGFGIMAIFSSRGSGGGAVGRVAAGKGI